MLLLALPAAAEDDLFVQSLAQAYQNNPGLQAERARLRAVDENVAEALSGYRPDIVGTASVGRTQQDIDSANQFTTGGSRSFTPRSMGIQATQPLFRGFRTTGGVKLAEAQVQAQRAQLDNAEQQLLLNAATAYLDVVAAQAEVELNKNNEDVLRRQQEATQSRFEVGEVTRTDVSQAESRVQAARAARIQAEGTLANRRATFARYVGTLPGKLKQPALDFTELKTIDDVVRLAENRNPNVIAAVSTVDAAREQVTVTKGSLLPEVNLQAGASRSWEPSSTTNRSDSLQIVAQATLPLYRSGADYARTRAAMQTVTQYRSQLDDARRQARESAINAWQSHKTAEAAIKARRAAVDANQLALEGVREESTVGTRTVLDVLDAEQELLDAEVNLVRAERDKAVAVLQLRAAIGSLTAAALQLPVERYDPKRHYDSVRNKWIGFGSKDK
jgi:outer membrane protein/adhesin transport system outer membrane protein